MPFYFFIFDFIILVVMLLFCLIQKNQNEINAVVSEMIKLNHEELKLHMKIKNAQIEKISQKLEFVEKKQIEMRANISLQNRRIDQIFAEKLSQDEYTEGLEVISEDFEKSQKWETEMEKKFALEIEEMRQKFEKITTSQYRRINVLEGKKSSKIFEEKTENIF